MLGWCGIYSAMFPIFIINMNTIGLITNVLCSWRIGAVPRLITDYSYSTVSSFRICNGCSLIVIVEVGLYILAEIAIQKQREWWNQVSRWRWILNLNIKDLIYLCVIAGGRTYGKRILCCFIAKKYIIRCYGTRAYSGMILGLRPANGRRRYFVTTSLIGWTQG